MSWSVYEMFCRVCSHEWTAVAEDGSELDYCECPNCGHMTGQAPEKDESDGAVW